MDFRKNFSQVKRKMLLSIGRLEWKRVKKLTKNEVPLLSQQIDKCARKCEEEMEKVKGWKGDLRAQEVGEATKPFIKIEEECGELRRKTRNYCSHSEDLSEEEVMSEVEQAVLTLLNLVHQESCYLFKIEKQSKNLHIFNIRERKFSKFEIDELKVGWAASTLTIGRLFYVAHTSYFARISPEGKVCNLGELPTPKYDFPMAYWREKKTIITLGGYDSTKAATEAQSYSIVSHSWRELPPQPARLYHGAAVVFKNEHLYNFGRNDGLYLNLRSLKLQWKWLRIKEMNHCEFLNTRAEVVGEQILFFGHYTTSNYWYYFHDILEQQEDSHKLKKVSSVSCSLHRNEYSNLSSCLLNGKLYKFQNNSYSAV